MKTDSPDTPPQDVSSRHAAATPERFFVVDGSALAYRSHFAFLRSSLRTRGGQPTGAVYGYCGALLRLLEDEDPPRMAVVFDSTEPTFRHN